ncbi:carbon starvation CstA family protein [Mariniblastus fucicola]|uniref:Inner membrane protein YjiY n=1 Tax=Mariniblastus fucicola TaxID=980251 RepID=A0A5B9P5K2_9BACT|nr:carbon starvation protein A [Mariniblastus fucicola]QEG20779.1 Inner membrane protein YjiY [Mariniblastus fucicola]
MGTFLIAVGSFVGFLVAYHTYGRWLSRKVFALDPNAIVPSCELEDGVDYVPSKKSIVFGHHFTSIAGTGPIVGPAIAVFWGWLPALLWVIFGSIFIGAVHDFGALVVSLRNRGQTVGEIAGRLISPRAKLLFLLVLFFALTIVLAIFGLVIAAIFKLYPESVLPVWISLPIAVFIGWRIRKGSGSILPIAMLGLLAIYASVWFGAYIMPISLDKIVGADKWLGEWNSTLVWTLVLFIYCGIASVLPVSVLLQPRDYINSLQLYVALVLLMIGLGIATLSGQADLFTSTPAYTGDELPRNPPPIAPFLFITIACGAVSGFHCLVSSGTSSKQVANETDAQAIGYGSMLLEGALAVMVILACCAGVGMGKFDRVTVGDGVFAPSEYVAAVGANEVALTGKDAWRAKYQTAGDWNDFNLGAKVGAFVEGGGNFISAVGIPLKLGIAIVAVLVACFAATTLDSATRLQRYVVQELGQTLHVKPLTNRYVATIFALVLGFWIAWQPGAGGVRGTGGLMLWPLFGATNQLLAGLALMVTTFYLWRRNKPVWFVVLPMVLMLILPFWALIWQLKYTFNFEDKLMLSVVAIITLGLQVWMVIEAMIAWPKAKGVLEEKLPPLEKDSFSAADGRSC